MGDHATLSPSSRYRWSVCPGSVREAAKLPEKPSSSSASAIDGTHTHTVLEWCLKNGMIKPEVGMTMTDHEGTFTIDAKRAERVQFAIDYIQSRTDLRPHVEIICEERVHPDLLLDRDDMSGTVDVQLVDSSGVEIIDYKDGINPVKAAGNKQMEQYAIGVLSKYAAQGRFFVQIGMTIIQPKAREMGGTGIDTVTVPTADIWELVPVIKAEAAATDDPDAPLVPGDMQCKYCPAAGGCRTRVDQSFAAMGVSFDQLAQKAADKEPNQMSDEELAEIIEAAPLIRQMLDGAETEALRRFESGHPVAGLKVVNGRGSRSWALPEEEMAEKLKRMGLPKEVLWKTSLITVAQAEKATWEKTRAGEKVHVQLTPRQLETLKKEYIKKSDGKLVVVPEADNRPAAGLFEIKMFDAVPAAIEPLPTWLT